MNILSTFLKRVDGMEVYYPNHILVQRVILNTRRSGDMNDSITMDVSFHTFNYELFQSFRSKLGEFIKQESSDFTGRFEVMIQEIGDNCQRLRLVISVQIRGNFMDSSRRYSDTCVSLIHTLLT
ncbi:hypothetical protein HMI54_013843 [Coelomomyces lativittatus]|nr:hypothetical protein HMI54_013843 [Coelomomyces lativittatus]